MPDVKFKLGMDNRIKPGLTTRDEILAALQAQGIAAWAAEPTFDPVTGELVQAWVNLPEGSAAQATAVIDANPGIAVATQALPEPLFIFDMENMVLATTVLNAPLAGTQWVEMWATRDAFVDFFDLGLVQDRTGTGQAYFDGGRNLTGRPFTMLQVFNSDLGTDDLVIPPSDLTLTFDGATNLVVANIANLVVPRPKAFFWYIDTTGKVYEAFTGVGPIKTFEQAVALGPV